MDAGSEIRRSLGDALHLDDEVALKYYRLQKISDGSIILDKGTGGEMNGPTATGTGNINNQTIELSHLIDILNDRFGTEFKPGDQLFFDAIREDAVLDSNLRDAAMANTMENFGYAFRKQLETLFINRIEQNEEITARFLNEKDFQKAVGDYLLKQVYGQIRADNATPTSTQI